MLLQHYIKIAFRNLLKYKVQSIISIVGLAIGLICFTYGWNWYRYETSYDGFYPQASNIYRVYGIDKQTGKKVEQLPLILARKLKKDFPEVKETTQIYSKFGSTFHYGKTRLEDPDEEFIDEQYFHFFPRPVICGKKDDILKTLDEIAVTRSFAVKYFKTPEEALGKTLRNGYREHITIVSVLEDAPKNSMMQTDVYELDKFDHERENRITEEMQWKQQSTIIYLMLEPTTNIQAFEKKINAYISEHDYNRSLRLKLARLTEVRHTFGSELTFNLSYIRTFTITGLLLLLCVFFNFTNLLLNRIYLRNKEMKLRNAIGADKKNMIFQLLLELTLLVGISFLLACCLLEITAGGFSRIFETTLQQDVLFSHLCIITGISWLLLTGICLPLFLRFVRTPSLLVSGGIAPTRKSTFRKTSMTLQLGICIFFLMSTFIMSRQISFMKHKDLGFKKDGLIQLAMTFNDREGISREISTLAILKGFTQAGIFSITHEPQTQNEVEWDGKSLDFAPNFQVLQVGSNFPEVFDIPIVKGRFVDEADMISGHNPRFPCTKAVINEEAARIMNVGDPIGKKISVWDYSTYSDGTRGRAEMEIVGVIKDFQSASLRNPILPQVIVIDGSKWTSYAYYARTEPGKEKAAIKAIRNVFKKHAKQGDPSTCEVQSINQILDQLNTSENASLQLFTLLAMFCTLISIFGLYSISSRNMEQRRKEIAVRKVMGASARTIVEMFFREYLAIVLIANLLALPLAWLFMQNWLQQYAYRSSVQPWMYIAIILFTTIIIICTVLYQTIRAARTNPAETIKSE